MKFLANFYCKTIPGTLCRYIHYLDKENTSRRRTTRKNCTQGIKQGQSGSGTVNVSQTKVLFLTTQNYITTQYNIVSIHNCSAHSTCLSLSRCSSTETYEAADTINTHLVSGTASWISTFINVLCKEINN